MKFILELSNGANTFRLQKDGNWLPITDRKITNGDFVTESANEIIAKQKTDSIINLEGRSWNINPSELVFGETYKLYYYSFTLRGTFPEIPSKNQLIETIKNGNDQQNNALVLNIHGKFELRNLSTINLMIEDPTIVVRHEAFVAGNGYVGEGANEITGFIDDHYKSSLESWISHLKMGVTNLYCDTRARNSEAGLLLEIEDLRTNFKAAY